MFASSPRFFLDPWASDYGSALEAEMEDDAQDAGEPPDYVEAGGWGEGVKPRAAARPQRIVFVDGVQRIDAYGRIEDGDLLHEAALASIAVGAAVCGPDASEFHEEPLLERVLAVTGGASAEPMMVRAGGLELIYRPHGHKVRGANGIRLAVNDRRSELERRYAGTLVADDTLTVLDGRLSFDPGAAEPIVGYIKTIHEFYIDTERRRLLPRLAVGERSPVFRIPYGRTTRYSWFLKLPHVQPIHHAFAGVVRLETPEIGEARALELADLTARYLPEFASRPEKDPRAPQNLIPVGALERNLRHKMGDPLYVRRSIERSLYEVANV